MIIIFGIIITIINIITIITIITIIIITTVTIINEATSIPSQPSMQFANDLEPRLELKDELRNKKGVKNLILYYSNLEYETVFNNLNAKMVGRNDIVFCAGPCYY